MEMCANHRQNCPPNDRGHAGVALRRGLKLPDKPRATSVATAPEQSKRQALPLLASQPEQKPWELPE